MQIGHARDGEDLKKLLIPYREGQLSQVFQQVNHQSTNSKVIPFVSIQSYLLGSISY